MPFTIAIDGPAASGKGTIARALAERFGFLHLDTGLLYRAVGALGGEPVHAAKGLTPEDLLRPGLRSAEAGQAASRVAAIPEVRAALVDFQRRFAAQEPGAVLDGRDIGTVICPGAQVKLYVVAADETRAARRAAELGVDPAEMLMQLRERDARDAARDTAPLRAAPDAVMLDTTELSIDQAVARAVALVEERLSVQPAT
ncbi:MULTISPECIES: d(CMP) kinase [unclassified Paracoccus (in: a-proteobacteria)]|uniref:(d)CMP kinase n=1 Tax=unclassified Paracoccus (in: a-proteobacteria) TaxID=2688777 RepID=UPI0016005671|nr:MULTISPECIES: d(CMP) kinase [unclassified Paracoccus (in: a-proteobacteria)]MBB1490895.1 (d)CMP kinase [Paracoccus sp. MC1854]MBB1497761.1 (d)CMP kinase [Paracoccus sp. MC1862]QQO45245.1 (d)CMP kinase [Paracoccus sp. MC1862]